MVLVSLEWNPFDFTILFFFVLIDFFFFFKLSSCTMHKSTILSLTHRLQEHWFLLSPWHVYIKCVLKCQVQAFCYRWRLCFLLSECSVMSLDGGRPVLCPNDISCVHCDRRRETRIPTELSVSCNTTLTFTVSRVWTGQNPTPSIRTQFTISVTTLIYYTVDLVFRIVHINFALHTHLFILLSCWQKNRSLYYPKDSVLV